MSPIERSGSGGGGGGGPTKLFDSTLAAPAASIDTGVNGVAAGFTALTLYVIARTVTAAPDEFCGFNFNGDVGTNQAGSEFNNTGVSFSQSGVGAVATAFVWKFPAATADANRLGTLTANIPFYASAASSKQMTGDWGYTVFAASNRQIGSGQVSWLSSAAINQIRFTATSGANFVAGSRMVIYGIT